MTTEAKQRFLALDVGEVSVVDTPANEVEFLVHKRLEEDPMTKENEQTPAPKATPGAEVVPVTTEKADGEAVAKAMAQVVNLVEGIAKAAGATASDPEDANDDKVEKAYKGMGAKRKAMRKELKDAGVSGDQMKKAMAAFDKCMDGMGNQSETEMRAKKSLETAPVMGDALDQLAALGQAIQKAKMFTPTRQEKMKTALEALKAVMDEMTEVPVTASPATATPTSPQFGDSGVATLTKAVSDLAGEVKKALEESAKQTADIAKRVETVEKARPASSVLATEEAEKPQGVKKSFWSGTL